MQSALRKPVSLPESPHDESELKKSLFEGSAYSLMVGFGETYVPPFAIAIGLGEISAGLIATLPLLVGAVLQMISPAMVKICGSYRRWVVYCALAQCGTFLLLMIAALVGYLPAPLAFLIMAVYWGSSMAISPAWNSWIATLVPASIRTTFFARRTRYTQLAALVGFLIGGAVLHKTPFGGKVLWSFAFLFLASFVFRTISAFTLSKISEPVPPGSSPIKSIPLGSMIGCFRKEGSSGKLLFYMLTLQLAAQTSAPFFTPFMLGQLSLTYPQFAALIAASFATKVICLPWLGRLAQKRGSMSVLKYGATGIAFIPALWLVSSNFYYLFVVQALTGLVWAAYELATVLLVLEKLDDDERIGMLTNYNLFNAFAVAVGSLIGASLLDGLGRNLNAYYALFIVSSLGRLGTLFFMRGLGEKTSRKVFFPSALLEFRHFSGFISPANWIRKSFRAEKRTRPTAPPTKMAS